MDSREDPRAEAYIAALPDWQQQICRRVRQLALAADPELQETIKRRVQPYYVLQGNVCALLAARDWVNVFLYSADVDDPAGLITGGHGNATGRTISLRRGQPLDGEAFTAILRQVIAQNRAGRRGGVRPDPTRPVDVPGDLRAVLDGEGLAGAFDDRPYYQRRHWVDTVTGAKRADTRERRIQAMLDDLRSGSGP